MAKQKKQLTLQEKSGRNSNIELLRIISMLMIVAYHYSIWEFYAEDIIYSKSKYFVDLFGMWGKLGTNIFILISGYYMVKLDFTLKKLLKIMGQLWFYTVGTLLVFALIPSLSHLVTSEFIKHSLFPLITSHYWFISYYVLLMLFSPFINKVLHSISKIQHLCLCFMLAMLCCVMREFMHITFLNGYLPLFVLLYVSAGYCRMHIPPSEKTFKHSLALCILLCIICIFAVCLFDYIGQKDANSELLLKSTSFIMNAYGTMTYLLALVMLVVFSSMAPRYNKLVSLLGSCTMGVYLFQSNDFISNSIWQALRADLHINSPYLIVHAFVSLALVFTAAVIVDLFRQATFARLWDKLVDRICPPLQSAIDKAIRLLEFIVDKLLAI